MSNYFVEIEIVQRTGWPPREVCMVVDEETAQNIGRTYREDDENQEIKLIGIDDDEGRVEICRRGDVYSLSIEPIAEE